MTNDEVAPPMHPNTITYNHVAGIAKALTSYGAPAERRIEPVEQPSVYPTLQPVRTLDRGNYARPLPTADTPANYKAGVNLKNPRELAEVAQAVFNAANAVGTTRFSAASNIETRTQK